MCLKTLPKEKEENLLSTSGSPPRHSRANIPSWSCPNIIFPLRVSKPFHVFHLIFRQQLQIDRISFFFAFVFSSSLVFFHAGGAGLFSFCGKNSHLLLPPRLRLSAKIICGENDKVFNDIKSPFLDG